MYRNWLWRIPAYALAIALGVVLLVNVVIDPYGEYNLVDTPLNHDKFFQTYEATPIKMFNKLKNDHYTLVFGTSHSSTISEQAVGDKVLNLSVSLYGNPIDVQTFLDKLGPEQIRNIDGIYFNIDYQTLTDKESPLRDIDFNSKFDYVYQTVRNLDNTKLYKSADVILKNLTKKQTTRVTDNGEFIYVKDIHYRPDPAAARTTSVTYTSDDKAIAALGAVDAWCKKNGVKITYFKTIFSKNFLQTVKMDTMKAQVQKILGQIDGLYSFQYVDGVSDDLRYFRDPTHHTFEATKIEMDLLKRADASSPYYVTRNNVDAYFDTLNAKLK